MHKLCRYVRFSINPFLPADEAGFNSFASKPTGEGLSVFLELGVELAGEADAATGLIVNVSDIDQKVRDCAVGVFAEKIKADHRAARHTGYDELVREFSREVADLVVELTHVGAKVSGKYFPVLHSRKAIVVKFADRLSNISRMDDWPGDWQLDYLNESRFWDTSPYLDEK